MTVEQIVGLVADGAAILTAIVAVVGYGSYRPGKRQRRRRLENYLREEKLPAEERSRHTILDLMGQLSMTEAEILAAAFASGKVSSACAFDWQGRAETLFLKYTGDDLPPRKRF